jgi:hypothetical protein
MHDLYIPAGEGGVANAFIVKKHQQQLEGYGRRLWLSRNKSFQTM